MNVHEGHTKIQRCLDSVLKEGVATAVMNSVLDYYLVPFALFKGASTKEIGFLSAIPTLISCASLLLVAKAVHLVGSRLRMILAAIGVQILTILPLIVLPLISSSNVMLLLIFLMTIYRFMGTLLGPAWGSLVSEYLTSEKRGRYFGKRQKALSFASIAGLTVWGIVLSSVKKVSPGLAFCLLFMGLAFFRVLSWFYMSQLIDLPQHHVRENKYSFQMFLRRLRESNFVRFVLYVAGITFATQLAAPYFTVLMLRDLHFGYLTYMAVNLVSVASSLFCYPIWGSHADMVGNAKVLKLTSFLIPVSPFLWVLSREPVYLILVEAFNGFVWAGFNLCVTNFIFDAVSPTKRVRYLGYFNLINGFALFAGATTGGFLADKLPVFGVSPIYSLILLSGVMRLLADLILSRHFTEVRVTHHHKVSSFKLFISVVGIRPLIDNTLESTLEHDAIPGAEQLRESVKPTG